MAWVLGGRDSATFKRLYDKVKHLENCKFYTDDWNAFSKILPPDRHIIGKAHTVDIEQDNSNTRHYIGRFVRKTKIVTKKEEMIEISLKLLQALTEPEVFKIYQDVALCIYREKLSDKAIRMVNALSRVDYVI